MLRDAVLSAALQSGDDGGSPDYDACTRSTDCALTPVACCGYEPVGAQSYVAVNQSHIADYGKLKVCDNADLRCVGTDVFVASYTVVQTKRDGHYFSYTTWAPVDSMLPRAEFIAMPLTKAESKSVFVPWAAAERLVGDCCLVPCAHLDAPRVRALRWPPPDVLEQLRAAAVDPGD